MTTAITATPPIKPSLFSEATAPVVFIDGVPDPDLSIVRLSQSIDASTNRAELVASPEGAVESDQLAGRSITIALPHRLTDGEVRWCVLMEGRIVSQSADRLAGRDDRGITASDRLAQLLADEVDLSALASEDTLALSALLRRIASLINADLTIACPPEPLDTSVVISGSGVQSYGKILLPALARLGLRLKQSLKMDRGRVSRSLIVISEQWGRRISLPWPDAQGHGGAVRSVQITDERDAPRAWIALGDRPVVEDTFDLQPGWDPALQGEADSAYGRLTSSDFSLYGSVYRAWVLNEDGAYSDAPFNLGSAFDAGSLFDVPGSLNQPLRFSSCLARDAAGRSIQPVIESSTDSGASWSPYPGAALVMPDRAGVVLQDDMLPATILSSAKAGTLRLRITASLTSPDPIQAMRWDGNPFAGPAPMREVRFGDSYGWRRVAPTSLHAASLADGSLSADTTDDLLLLRQALLKRVTQLRGAKRSARVVLDGAWTSIQPGDRVAGVVDRATRIDASPVGFAGPEARVTETLIDFGVASKTPRTRLTLD